MAFPRFELGRAGGRGGRALLILPDGGQPLGDRPIGGSQHRSVTVTDIVPVQRGDYRGRSGFYLVVGWSLGGYLVAALLGITSGARPATTRRALNRLIAFGSYAIVSGLAGAIVVGPVLGALTGHLIALWWLGVLRVFAVGAVTLAFQTLFGVIGIGITILFFVILGNPSAGDAYQPALLPPFLAGHQLGPAQRRRDRRRTPHRLLRRLRHRRPSARPGQLRRRGGRHHHHHRVHHLRAPHGHWLTRPADGRWPAMPRNGDPIPPGSPPLSRASEGQLRVGPQFTGRGELRRSPGVAGLGARRSETKANRLPCYERPHRCWADGK